MAEVQHHGNTYEDIKIREYTGLSKKEYDKLKKSEMGISGYTSPHDLVSGLLVDFDGSIKSTGSNSICCGDVILRMKSKEYKLIVGVYEQIDKIKRFHTEYIFHITNDDYVKLWGNMSIETVGSFVDFVKSIPQGSSGQKDTLDQRNILQEQVQCKESLFIINPKVDSKKQRRVQCSLKLDKLLVSGIKYEKRELDISIQSSRRKFNK